MSLENKLSKEIELIYLSVKGESSIHPLRYSMYKYTNPILEVIQDTDKLLANTYHKIAIALAKKGNVRASKDWFKKWSEALKHLKNTRKEIETNEREAEQSLAVWRNPDFSPGGDVWSPNSNQQLGDGSYLSFEDPIGGQDQQSTDRGFDSEGIHGLST